MNKNSFKKTELALYYLVVFFILREWLIPIMELTGTGYMEYILLFIAVSLVISLFRIHFILSWLIKGLFIAWFIAFVYGQVWAFSAEGIQFLANDLIRNLYSLMHGDWIGITDPFRTLLFFILIWMLIYLTHYWITVRMNIFYFLALTVFFVAALDTFTDYDGSFAIVRIMLLGLVMIASLFLKRLVHHSNVQIKWPTYIKMILPSIGLIVIVMVIAFFLPKAAPQWPDPMPYIKSATGQGQAEVDEGGIAKVGYGENDTRLGGSFVADDTVVFLAEVQSKQYWRIETKDIYTSKGWENSGNYGDMVIQPEENIVHSLPVGPKENSKTAAIQMLYEHDFVVQPYGLQSYHLDEEYSNLQFLMNGSTEKIKPYLDGNEVFLMDYQVEYSKPEYSYSTLKNPTEQIDPAIKERYLQLPDTLPARVRELAADIVEDKQTPYDQARAIELYFRQNGFRYDTDNIAVPAENQDYVDQFLFETKVGYCDNFSTSMVVLLRSIGIPARWVKGFAGGDMIDNNGATSTYQVTNNDAHSWVEAYIPNVGWVNFEPTIGFNNSRAIDYDLPTDTPEEDELTIDEDTKPDEVVEENEKRPQSTGQNSNIFGNVFARFTKNKVVWLIVALLIASVGGILYKTRRRWLPNVYGMLYKRKSFMETPFETSYLRLLKLLEVKGFKRKKGQTLESYALEIDRYFETVHMTKLTKCYERVIYAKNAENIDMALMKESWEYLINQVIG
ncbi:transglutaminase [Lysinibacillus yapensis]|uniref:Transglutaminase n=1 Tax=Ureibacillus yapensis TaxID=2304605 RepID=A0A396S9U3_9BACL|nr:transglutaminaseTgpA domain-containing protein [Lysinibacillus yapensis]RHW32427.1 transglutaminase [Lysinibacillus yapensis]